MRSDFHEMAARIETLLASRAGADTAPASFRWEAGSDGTIHWVEGIARAAMIGRTIAAPAGYGDGAGPPIVEAFARRVPFRDAPFDIDGDSLAAGAWRMAGVPVFDSRSGAFSGFRGSAHRATGLPANRLEAAPAMRSAGHEVQPDSMRQLVHELRTPLNAIVGFAEMIDGQHLGPAGASYRARAAGIRQQAAHLLSAVEDLDLAARTESSGIDQARATDIGALLGEIEERLNRTSEAKGWGLRIEIAPGLPAARIEREVADRLLTRLIASTVGATAPDEVLPGWLRFDEARCALLFCINRPRRLAHLSVTELTDPLHGLKGEGTGDPALGFGFTLRLGGRIAEALGGSLDIHAGHLLLALPACSEGGRKDGA